MNLKALIEKRNALIADIKSLCDKATAETRAMTTEEQTDYDAKKAEVEALNKTIRSIEEQNALNLNSAKSDGTATDKEQAETRAFENYLRTGQIVETREDVNLTKGDNGAVIPATIANKIIRKVIDICPIYQMATRYTLAGTLSIPYYDEGTQAISMAYATEFTDLASTSGKFLSIELKGYLAGALSKVSRSLINNSQFDIVSYVINEVSIAAAKWIENQLINGTASKIDGLAAGVTQVVTTASATAITADELIDLQETIPDVYQDNACWIMNKATRTAIRKLKDNEGRYILNPDATAKCGYIDSGVIPKYALCSDGVNWFKDRGQWADYTAEPTAGQIIFFDWDDENGQDGVSDHTGIVEKVENGIVYTVEGNSGDTCRQKQYPVGYYEILGYGIPAY